MTMTKKYHCYHCGYEIKDGTTYHFDFVAGRRKYFHPICKEEWDKEQKGDR